MRQLAINQEPPTKMVPLNFKLPAVTRNRLIAIAGADHRTLTSLMVKIVSDYLAKEA